MHGFTGVSQFCFLPRHIDSRAYFAKKEMVIRGELRPVLLGNKGWRPHLACCQVPLHSPKFWLEACPDCVLTFFHNFLTYVLRLRTLRNNRRARGAALRVAQSLDQCWPRLLWLTVTMLPRLLGWQSLPRDKSEALLLGQGTFEEHMWYCGFVREQKLGLNLEVDAFLRLLLVLVDDFVHVPWAGCWCQLMTAIHEHQIVSHKFGEVCIDIGFWRCALTTIPEQKRVKAGATAKHCSHTL